MEVIKNGLESIADGMALTVVRTSRSSVVRTSLDFSTGVLDSMGNWWDKAPAPPRIWGA